MNDHNTPLVPFQFESHAIRVLTIDGQPWFVAKDVAETLGYKDTVNAIKQHCKGVAKHHPLSTAGGMQEARVINQSDTLRLIIGSSLPEAERFEKWVFEEVLPSILQTGSYSLPGKAALITKQSIIETSLVTREVARALRASGLKGNALALAADNVAKMTTGVSLLSMAGMTHLIANEQGRTYSPTELGKMCSPTLSGQKLNLLMEAAGLQAKEYGNWMPTDAADGLFEWLDTNKRHSNGTPVKQLRWFRIVLDRLNIGGQQEAA
ncbi:MAG TPA: Bro-N domain-containing protein [Candidatus Competibacteraceae bacterium]|nr:Bro-N domain-containing protein [Candidatus Competibacteraceae bacterium]